MRIIALQAWAKSATELNYLELLQHSLQNDFSLSFSPNEGEYNFKNINDPAQLKDCSRAAAKIIEYIKVDRRIVIVGDYDVDGICAATTMQRFFIDIGFKNYRVFLPDRFKHGYGLNVDSRADIMELQPELIITVDNGINSLSEEQYYFEHDIELIVTDHHQPSEGSTPRNIVVDPKQPDCPYPDKEISGTCVAFLLLIELRRQLRQASYFNDKTEPNLSLYIDLVTLGTVADTMPLQGINRLIVYNGLKIMKQQLKSGKAPPYLMKLAELGHSGEINTDWISYYIAPLINSAGRIRSPYTSYLFLSELNPSQAQSYFEELLTINATRKKMQQVMIKNAVKMVEEEHTNQAIVLFSEDFHQGLSGIIASAMVTKYSQPTVVISPCAGKHWRGSGRSPEGIDLLEILSKSADHLIRFGGHRNAAGITIEQENIKEFIAMFKASYQELYPTSAGKPDNQELVIELAPWMLSLELLNLLECFEPFGKGNKKPGFMLSNLDLRKPSTSTAKISKWILENDVELVKFGEPRPQEWGEKVNLMGRLTINNFRGKKQLQFNIDQFL